MGTPDWKPSQYMSFILMKTPNLCTGSFSGSPKLLKPLTPKP